MASKIEEIFFQHRGNQIDKWEQYIKIYDIEFSRFAQSGRPVDLLEIGVQNGGSLDLWASYLPPGSEIHGVDIDPNVMHIKPSQSSIHIHVIDGTTDKMLELFSNKKFDIIIDDGSHISDDIIKSFARCFRLVKPGGLYVIEDLHAAYYKSHGGGLNEPTSAMNYLKKLIDTMHVDYIDKDLVNLDAELVVSQNYNRLIGRITFYDSMTVIEKLKQPKTAPYRRIISGTAQDAVDTSQWLSALPRPQLTSLCFSSQATERIDHHLIDKIERLEEKEIVFFQIKTALNAQIEDLQMEAEKLKNNHALELDNQAEFLRNEITTRQTSIEALEVALQDLERRHSLALERQMELSRDEVANRQTRIEELETALRDLNTRHSLSLETQAELLNDEMSNRQAHIEILETELRNYEVKFNEVKKEYDNTVEQLYNANNYIINLRWQFDQEKSEANRVITEIRGKLDRAYAAWASKKTAVDRLKSGRLSSGKR